MRFCTLYLDNNLQLWLIPYPMRRDVGQAPRHLVSAGNTHGWVWLGSPGWYGSLSPELIVECKRMHADEARDLQWHNEWEEIVLEAEKYPLLDSKASEWKPRLSS